MAGVPASEATRKWLREMLEGGQGAERSALLRDAVRLIIEEALEAEVTDELGRGYYDRGEREQRSWSGTFVMSRRYFRIRGIGTVAVGGLAATSPEMSHAG